MRLKALTGKRVRITHTARNRHDNTLHGILITVSRDYVILMDFAKTEHPIRRNGIKECELI
jgi:hypothetical protein